MEFLKFLQRHLFASVLGALGLILLVLGYADQASDIWSESQPWQLQALGATFFVVAVILILFRWDQRLSKSEVTPAAKTTANSAPAAVVPQPAPTSAASLNMEEPSARTTPSSPFVVPDLPAGEVLVAERVTGRFLRQLCEGKTTHQQQLVAAPYLGKWITLSGSVRDVRPGKERGWSASMAEPDREMPEMTYVEFQKDQTPKVEMLSVGDAITVLGNIESFDQFSLHLNDAKLM